MFVYSKLVIANIKNWILFAEISCDRLSIDNGTLSYNPDSEVVPFDFGTVATYSCNDEYYLAGGIGMRTCGGEGYTIDSGLWNGTDPECRSKQTANTIVY